KSISPMRSATTQMATAAIDSHTSGANRLKLFLILSGLSAWDSPGQHSLHLGQNLCMSLFANLVAVSQRVGATTARLAKIRELAACLRAVEPNEIDTAVHYLSGEIPQGRFGIGYATLRKASERGGVATTATLTI